MATPVLMPSTRAEVGKFYMVPCVRLLHTKDADYFGFNGKHNSADAHGWVVVIGPEHHDRDTLKFMAMHFHVDVRFLSDNQLKRHDNPFTGRPAESNAMTIPVSTWSDGVGSHRPIAFERALRRKQCKRAMPDFPNAGHAEQWRAFEQSYGACKLKPGNICPHRGIDLTPFIKDDGTVICPGHGLRWNTKTGEPLPHHARPA